MDVVTCAKKIFFGVCCRPPQSKFPQKLLSQEEDAPEKKSLLRSGVGGREEEEDRGTGVEKKEEGEEPAPTNHLPRTKTLEQKSIFEPTKISRRLAATPTAHLQSPVFPT